VLNIKKDEESAALAIANTAAGENGKLALAARLRRSRDRPDEEERLSELETALGELAQGRPDALAAWGGWGWADADRLEAGAAWIFAELSQALSLRAMEELAEDGYFDANEALEGLDALFMEDDSEFGGYTEADAEANPVEIAPREPEPQQSSLDRLLGRLVGRGETLRESIALWIPDPIGFFYEDGEDDESLRAVFEELSEDLLDFDAMLEEIEGMDSGDQANARGGAAQQDLEIEELERLFEESDTGRGQAPAAEARNELIALSAARLAATRLAGAVALWAKKDGAPSFWELLAIEARERLGEAQWPAARAAIAWLARAAAARTSEMWLRTARAGAEADAIELAGLTFFGPLGATATIGSAQAELESAGWTPRAWERALLDVFQRQNAPSWPAPGMSAATLDNSWAAMQARGGALAREWAKQCAEGWDGMHGASPSPEAGPAPRRPLERLFASGAWEWIASAPSVAGDPMDNWPPRAPWSSDKALSAGQAQWEAMMGAPAGRVDATLAQIERVYGGAALAPGWIGEPQGRSRSEQGRAAWGMIRDNWKKRLIAADDTQRADLRRAWARAASWMGSPGDPACFMAWSQQAVMSGCDLGEDFVRECAARSPKAWRRAIDADRWVLLSGMADWPDVEGAQNGLGFGVRVTEWLALQGQESLLRWTLAQGAKPMRESWVNAVSRWAEQSREASGCRAQAARAKALFETQEFERIAREASARSAGETAQVQPSALAPAGGSLVGAADISPRRL
jgi:hypothetical protein